MTQPPLRNLTGIPRRPSLVGRDAELAALDEQVALVRTGAFRVVLVTGEPGIGKSRLVNELAERQRDCAVVVGSRAFELGMTYSLALWVEAFERLLELGTHCRGSPAVRVVGARPRAGASVSSAGAWQRPGQAGP